MKKICVFLAPAAFFLVFLLLFISCDRECVCTYPEEPEEQAPEYHLIYGPAGGGVAKPYTVLTYSTKTGEVVDSTLSDYVWTDIQFTRDGSKTVYTGEDLVPFDSSHWATWVIDNATGVTISIFEGFFGSRLYLDPEERFLLLCKGGFAILTFPGLDPVYIGTVSADGGGFLTAPGKAFYYHYNLDSLFVVDLTNVDSVTVTAVPTGHRRPTAVATDYDYERLFLISSFYPPEGCYIQVRDSDSLSLIQELALNKFYRGIAIHPDGERVFLYNTGPRWHEWNRIGIFDIKLNVVRAYLRADDILGEDPFQPRQVEFTPDGTMMFILNFDEMSGTAPVLGIRLSDKALLHYLKPRYAQADAIAIDPIDRSQK